MGATVYTVMQAPTAEPSPVAAESTTPHIDTSIDASIEPSSNGMADVALPLPQSSESIPGVAQPNRRRILTATICLVIAIAALLGGLELRSWIWQTTYIGRFQGDIRNGFRWGLEVNVVGQNILPGASGRASAAPTLRQWFAGFHAIYSRQANGPIAGVTSKLDYTPMRLAVMSLWVNRLLQHEPWLQEWRDDLSWPLVWFNTFCEFSTAIGAFVLVRMIFRRAELERFRQTLAQLAPHQLLIDEASLKNSRATASALAAALLVWFNPAMLLEAHGWPQWDVWCMPFFVWAAVACFGGFWTTAGVLLVVGAMFKGQLMFVAPMFLLWPLLEFRIAPAARLVVGFAFGTAVITSIWLLPTPIAAIWVAGAMLAVQLERFSHRDNMRRSTRYLLSFAWIALLVWPIVRSGVGPSIITAASVAALAFPIALLPQRHADDQKKLSRAMSFTPTFTLFVIIGAIIFSGNLDWLRLGFLQPTDHYRQMSIGAANLPGWMENKFGWQLDDALLAPLTGLHLPGWITALTVQLALRYLMAIALFGCAAALAVNDRRKDVRVLVALVAPWVIDFAVLPQMHERYLIWGAVFTAFTAVINFELFALFLLTNLIAFGMIAHAMLDGEAGTPHPAWAHFFDAWFPGVGLVALVVAMGYFLSIWRVARAPVVVRVIESAGPPNSPIASPVPVTV